MNAIIVSCLAMLSCYCFLFHDNGIIKQKGVKIISLILLIIAGGLFFSKVYDTLTHYKVWDFTCFYLYGKVAASGYDFYSPENFKVIFSTLDVTFSDYEGFVEEVVNTGFLYPPPTMMYFAPLGFLSYNTALIVWTIVNLFFAFACIFLAYDLFFKKHKLNGLILVATLFFLLFPVRLTVYFSQTNFILFYFILMFKKYEDRKYSGVFLALAFFTKPYVLIFMLFLLLRKNWSAILLFCVAAMAICLITAAFFGFDIFYSYLFNNSAQRLPDIVFTEDINQSLHAVLLRAGLTSLKFPVTYLVIAGFIMLATFIFIVYLNRKRDYSMMQYVLLLVALLIYPGTLSYYGVLLLFITYQLFEQWGAKENEFLSASIYSILLVGIFFFLSSISLFATVCFLLAVILYKSILSRKIVY
jgi:Glycosyltransferase family 87